MGAKLAWLPFVGVTLFLGWYLLIVARVQLAGDMADYWGVTQSLLSHGGLELTVEEEEQVSSALRPEYFSDPTVYPAGRDGEKYSVHFVAYSLLVVPFRLLFQAVNVEALKALWGPNFLALTVALGVVMAYFVRQGAQRWLLLILFYTSPMIFFLIWPGPDIWFLSLLLVAVFAFFDRRYLLTAVLTAMASWHSQPLLVAAMISGVYALYRATDFVRTHDGWRMKTSLRAVGGLGLLGAILAVPFAYNLFAFGVLTPWLSFKDGWTELYGFGFHNLSLKKLFEQFFDLNVGLLWYAPLLVVTGLIPWLGMAWRNRNARWLLVVAILTAFMYQNNPAWHYGTAGYGPTRHVLFMIPLLIYFAVRWVPQKAWRVGLVAALLPLQIAALSVNGFLEPDLTKTLDHSPYARLVLERWPQLYNPTPEIFVDRTNHTDFKYPSTGTYKVGQECRKAYVLKIDLEAVEAVCGRVPASVRFRLDNEFLRKATVARSVATLEATFWPDTESCEAGFVATTQKPYQCMKTVEEVIKYTGVDDPERVASVENYVGVWRIHRGQPLTLTVPPGYIVHHYSFEGEYVDYTE